MRDAIAFIHPSAFESLGIVLLEAFMMGTPALVNKRSDVLREHIRESEAGYSYDTYEEFRYGLSTMMNDIVKYETLHKNARDYFLKNYSLTAFRSRLLDIFSMS
jgi:glycosyltransferase involved in cell wall biosynthesis